METSIFLLLWIIFPKELRQLPQKPTIIVTMKFLKESVLSRFGDPRAIISMMELTSAEGHSRYYEKNTPLTTSWSHLTILKLVDKWKPKIANFIYIHICNVSICMGVH